MIDDDDTLLCQLFYVLTAHLEDLAGVAVEGQAKGARHLALANDIAGRTGQVAIIAQAAAVLAEADA